MQACPLCGSPVAKQTIQLGTFSSVFDNCWPPCSIKPFQAYGTEFYVCERCDWVFVSKRNFLDLKRDVDPKDESMRRHVASLKDARARV